MTAKLRVTAAKRFISHPTCGQRLLRNLRSGWICTLEPVSTSYLSELDAHFGSSRGKSMRPVRLTAIAVLLSLSLIVGVSGEAGARTGAIRHARKPQVSIDLFGDSLSFTLGFGLNGTLLRAKYDYSLRSLGILGCGVVDSTEIMYHGQIHTGALPCNDSTPPPGAPMTSQPWQVQYKADLKKYPANVGVLLAGRWEEVDRLYMGQWTDILNPPYAAYVMQQLQLVSKIVTSTGANMVFLTAPCFGEPLSPDGTPWPEDSPARQAAYNDLVRQVAAENPKTDSVVDLNAAICPGNKYSATYKGVTIRTPDGIHFTLAAGPAIAPAIMPKIVAAGRAQMTRVSKKSKKHR
jgi:hypothetical protein